MAKITRKPLKLKQFRSDLAAADFADGLEALPGLSDALRLAGLRDGEALAAVRARSAERAELRAKALKRPAEVAAAARMKQNALALGQALKHEANRVMPEEASLGKVVPGRGGFRVVGKVARSYGSIGTGLEVLLRGEKSGATFVGKVQEDGIFDIAVATGEGDGKAVAGEALFYQVRSGRKVLLEPAEPAAVVTPDEVARLRVLLPKLDLKATVPGDIKATRPEAGRKSDRAQAGEIKRSPGSSRAAVKTPVARKSKLGPSPKSKPKPKPKPKSKPKPKPKSKSKTPRKR